MICCNQYKNEASLQCGSTCDPSDHQPDRMICCNVCIHLCSFSPLWASMWFFRSPAKPNDLLLASFFRVPASLNYLLHLLHLCGFSPVWKSMCLLRFPAWLNDLLQMVHLCGFSSVCVIMCFLRLLVRPICCIVRKCSISLESVNVCWAVPFFQLFSSTSWQSLRKERRPTYLCAMSTFSFSS